MKTTFSYFPGMLENPAPKKKFKILCHINIENRIYISGEFKESLGMNQIDSTIDGNVEFYTLSTVVFCRHKCQISLCVRQNYQ